MCMLRTLPAPTKAVIASTWGTHLPTPPHTCNHLAHGRTQACFDHDVSASDYGFNQVTVRGVSIGTALNSYIALSRQPGSGFLLMDNCSGFACGGGCNASALVRATRLQAVNKEPREPPRHYAGAILCLISLLAFGVVIRGAAPILRSISVLINLLRTSQTRTHVDRRSGSAHGLDVALLDVHV